MAAISPFPAIRYPHAKQTDLVAPPYDVLSAADKARLLAKNGHNIVALDLPHVPPKDAGPDAAYDAAGHLLHHWLDTGILARDPRPALYPYRQSYSYNGTTYHRRGFFARVRLEDFGPGSMVHPHEQTFSGPKEDRLKLMRATKANLSPVFGLYDDPANDVTDLLFEALAGAGALAAPLASAELPTQDGKASVLSELWSVTDPAVIRDIQLLMADKHLYIADGHHRYTTALNYRNELSDARGVPLGQHEPANFALFVLVALQDPGLIILPTHRVVSNTHFSGFFAEKFKEIAKKHLQIIETKLTGDSISALDLPGFGPHAMGLYDPVLDQVSVLRPKSPDPLAAFSDDPQLAAKSAAWRQLDVAILQHLVFGRLLQPHFVTPGQQMSWAFPHEAHEVASLCRSGQYRLGFLLQPTPLSAVRDLCNANELMPQKSTFFYPKLATGLVLNPLD